jgi:hypothetical protein
MPRRASSRQSTIAPITNRQSVNRQSSIVNPSIDDPQSTIRNISPALCHG